MYLSLSKSKLGAEYPRIYLEIILILTPFEKLYNWFNSLQSGKPNDIYRKLIIFSSIMSDFFLNLGIFSEILFDNLHSKYVFRFVLISGNIFLIL